MSDFVDPPDPHKCITWGDFTPCMRVGSIIRCDCGRYWYRTTDEWSHPIWRPVRWWNFTARRRIRETPQ